MWITLWILWIFGGITCYKNDITIKLSTNGAEKEPKQYWIGQYNVDKGGRKYVGI